MPNKEDKNKKESRKEAEETEEEFDEEEEENGNGEENGSESKEKKQEINEKGITGAEITEEMEKAYIDYAMSVIVARALPSVEDGLKPVHRRILYAMELLGLKPSSQTRKCARIVGDVLGKFHPHGDMAVYDALVRMAQDFSLRYPLVIGQGNFGCFTADTKIKLTDGRDISFADLIEEHQKEKRNFTFTIDENGTIKIAEIKNPRKTKENAEIMKVILDNGEEIKCTLNHKFMLRNGDYKEAKDLKPKDSLMPLYLRTSIKEDDKNAVGYTMVYQPKSNLWSFVHVLSDEWNLGNGAYARPAGRLRHHIDFNKLNNNPENIKRMHWKEHWQAHYDFTSSKHKNDSSYRQKLADGRKKFWGDEKNRKDYSQRMTERNLRNWKKEDYRQQMKITLSEINKNYFKEHPEIKEKISINLKLLWKRPDYRSMMSEMKSREMRQRWKDKDPSLKGFSSEDSKKIWANPEHKKYISGISKKYWLVNKDKVIKAYKDKWENDPDFRKYFLPILSENGKKVNYHKFLVVCRKTFEIYNEINEENYEKIRKSYNNRNGAGIIKLDSALKKFFNANIENLYKELGIAVKLNHKIKEIIFLKEHENVYDLTIDNTHNFALASGIFVHNSLDNDPPAAQRYTEAKLSPIAMELLEDLDRETVKFVPNFDNTLKEPELIPAKLPNLLINGASGIAVGMATNIPPHNLTEVCDAVIKYIENPEVSIEKLADIIKGPDFPTGGSISGDMLGVYKTGRGRITLRGKLAAEEKKGRERIIVTEIPYMLNKSDLVSGIAKLAQEKKLIEISDIRDESAKGKIRIVVELRRGVNSKFVINKLYKYTRLQDSFDINMLALVKGKPQILDLKKFIFEYVRHRKDVVEKRTRFDLKKAEERLEIVLGLIIALKDIDNVIALIKKAEHATDAKEKLIDKYKLTIKQAEAILETKLSALTHLEQDKLKKEEQELKARIDELKKILSSEQEILNVIRKELLEVRRKYGDERKTQVLEREIKELEEKDLVQKTDVVVTITDKGYAKRMDVKTYKEQKRGGKGVIGSDLAMGDFVKQLLTCSTHDYLLFFTSKGKVYWLKAYEIPAAERYGKGKALVNMLSLKDETIQSVIAVKKFDDYLMFATKQGIVKRLALQQLSKLRASGIRAVNLPADNSDILIDALPIKDKQEVLLVTKKGLAIRFNSDDVRVMGRASYGVAGTRLNAGDEVVSLEVLPSETAKTKDTILTITEKGYGKRSEIDDYRLINRGGKGVINLKVTAKTGEVIKTVSVQDEDSIIVTTAKGMVIRSPVKQIRIMSRATQGVHIVRLKGDDKVTDIVKISEIEEEENKSS